MRSALRVAAALLVSASAGPLTDLVDPFIGTGGGNGLGSFAAANLSPGAMAPFPLLRLGPDTTYVRPSDGRVLYLGNDHIAGYSFNDTHVLAFSHTHVQGGGCGDLGSFGVALAASANLSQLLAPRERGDAPYKTALDHAGESARPGAYALRLPELGGSLVELVAAGAASGLHRYTCAAAQCTLLVDACHGTHDGGCPAANASLAPLPGSPGVFVLTASVLDNGYFARQGGGAQVWVHLHAVLEVAAAAGGSAAAVDVGLWSAGAPLPPGTPATPANDTSGSVGVYASVPGPATLLLRVALSLVSPSGAAANLAAEQAASPAPGAPWLPLEALRARTDGVWEGALRSIVVGDEGGREGGAAAGKEGGGAAAGAASGAGAAAAAPALPLPQLLQPAPRRRLPPLSPLPSPPPPPSLPPCPPPAFDPAYLALLPSYFNQSGNVPWLARQGLPANASGAAIAAHIWALSCYAPPPLTTPQQWRSVLYTALYHALCAPTTASDADGAYVGLDGRVAQWGGAGSAAAALGGGYFSDLSLWDIHRTAAPLLALVAPRAGGALSASLLAQARARAGVLPRWPFASVDTRIMCGDHGLAVLADGVIKGLAGGSGGARGGAYAAEAWGVAQSTLRARGQALPGYAARGWVAVEEAQGYCRGGTLTLEYGFDDAAAAALAGAAGAGSEEAALRNRSASYAHLWSQEHQALCPRWLNGSLLCDAAALAAPFPFNDLWTEADGAQMAWYAPHAPAGLAALRGSSEAYAGAWDALLRATGAWPLGTFMPNAGAWVGNEPSLLIPWQGAWGPPWGAARTQAATRALLAKYYTLRFDGIPGNDDYGTMSAGAVWALLGLYPLVSTEWYVLGSPTFGNVTLGLGSLGGGALTIAADRRGCTTCAYVASVALNGRALAAPFVRHSELLQPPALLEFVMADAPVPWDYTPPV